MKLKTVGRKVTLKQNFLSLAEKRMAKFDKYFDDDAEGTVTVTVDSNRQTVEITVKNRGYIYRAERTEFDMETAFAEAADIIDRQITKNKTRFAKKSRAFVEPAQPSATVPDDEQYNLVREKTFEIQPMSVDDAIYRMEMLGHSFFIFTNISNDAISVVYKRRDEGYGLLNPLQK